MHIKGYITSLWGFAPVLHLCYNSIHIAKGIYKANTQYFVRMMLIGVNWGYGMRSLEMERCIYLFIF
jgi:hypothetical protein